MHFVKKVEYNYVVSFADFGDVTRTFLYFFIYSWTCFWILGQKVPVTSCKQTNTWDNTCPAKVILYSEEYACVTLFIYFLCTNTVLLPTSDKVLLKVDWSWHPKKIDEKYHCLHLKGIKIGN